MTILDRANIFGTATRLQLECWDEKDTTELKIAVYPVITKKIPEFPYQRIGDTFRVVLDQNFKDEDELRQTYRRIKNGRLPLSSCKEHFASILEASMLGI